MLPAFKLLLDDFGNTRDTHHSMICREPVRSDAAIRSGRFCARSCPRSFICFIASVWSLKSFIVSSLPLPYFSSSALAITLSLIIRDDVSFQ